MMGPSTNYELGKTQHEEYEASMREYWAYPKTAERPVSAKKRLVRWSSTFAILVGLFHKLTLRGKLVGRDHYTCPEKFRTTFQEAEMGQNFSGELYRGSMTAECTKYCCSCLS